MEREISEKVLLRAVEDRPALIKKITNPSEELILSTKLYYGELLMYQITELTKEDLILSEYLHAEWKAPLYNELLKEG